MPFTAFPSSWATYRESKRIQKEMPKPKPERAERFIKSFIKVDATFEPDGRILPKAIYWGGKRYTVDRLVDFRRSVSMKFGSGDYMYLVVINGRERVLYREYDTMRDTHVWFVEERESEPGD